MAKRKPSKPQWVNKARELKAAGWNYTQIAEFVKDTKYRVRYWVDHENQKAYFRKKYSEMTDAERLLHNARHLAKSRDVIPGAGIIKQKRWYLRRQAREEHKITGEALEEIYKRMGVD